MGHILGPKSHVSVAACEVGNTISPWDKGPSQEGVAILVSYDLGSIALDFCTCFSGLAH